MLQQDLREKFLKLRKQRLHQLFAGLNPEQRAAVLHTEGPLLLLAGAGSGKTTVLINRIANLVKFGRAYHSEEVPNYITEEDVAFLEAFLQNPNERDAERADYICAVDPAVPWSILAITFTNKAAKEIKERLERAVGAVANDIWASTFHAACVRILRRDIERLGYDKSFTIYDQDDSQRVMKEVMKELEISDKLFPPKSVLSEIGRAKDRMIDPATFAKETGGEFRREKIALLYEKYQKRLRAANALDFDDIIRLTVTLLQTCDEVRAFYQKKFRYVLIDEYQDTNYAQYLLASLLAGGHGNICVVGDDDQSIYRFRGATVENILQFEDQYKNATTIRLEQNYRSTEPILTVANDIISNNEGRKGKTLWTDKKEGELPLLYCAETEQAEARYIAEQAMEGYSQGKKWRDFAVLYRINAQSNAIEQAFQRNGVPYRVIGGHRFFDRMEIKDMLAYLWVILNPADTLRLKRIINVPARKIGAATIELVERLAQENQLTFYEVLQKANLFPELHSSAPRLMQFAEMMERLRHMATEKPLAELYAELVEKTGYVEALKAKEKEAEENQTRIENIWEFQSTLLEFDKREEGGLEEFMAEIALFTDIENYDQEADAVVLMTIHSAKGLEFPTVFLCGAEEGIFPGVRAMYDDAEVEEERRLMYVAVTRARENLIITRASSRMLFGQTTSNRPSRFLGEIKSTGVRCEQSSLLTEPTRKTVVTTPRTLPRASVATAKKQAPRPDVTRYVVGKQLRHKSFGKGMVVSATPVGGDVLLEIAFDSAGTKRLLLNTAAQYLEENA